MDKIKIKNEFSEVDFYISFLKVCKNSMNSINKVI